MNEPLVVNAIVTAAQQDLKRGVKKEDLLASLSKTLGHELFGKVKDRL